MGGKWTSFRRMGQETIEAILKNNKMETKYEESQTDNFNLIGSYSRVEAINGLIPTNESLFNQYEDHIVLARDLPRDVAKHLVHTYGTSALRVVALGEVNEKAGQRGTNARLHEDYPFIKSEIAYAAKHELAMKPNDIICRRVPIAFLNKDAAKKFLPETIEILAKEHKWSSTKKTAELKEAEEMLKYLK